MPIRHLIACFAAILALFLSGCASAPPSPAQMLAETGSFQLPHRPDAGKEAI